MADKAIKAETAAEKAYAEASAVAPAAKKAAPARRKPAAAKPATAQATAKPAPAIAAEPAAPVAEAAAETPVVVPAQSEATAAEVAVPEMAAPEVAMAEPAAPILSQAVTTSIPPKKDFLMTTDFASNMTETMSGAVTEMQTRLQEAFDKSTAMLTEMTDLAKGNVEAVVESGKVLSAGLQDMSKGYADEAKTAYETATADMKEMAAIKSPTELFQLQGKIMRRNFDAMVAATSKSTDAMLKLANDSVAPISGRVTVAADKLAQVA